MSRIIRLTESDLIYLIKDVINESFMEKKINDVKIINKIQNELGNKVSSGNFVLQIGGAVSGGVIIRHPDYDNNKKQIKISIKDQSGIPSKGTWSINGTHLILKQ
jgi:hypothetical protein